MTYTSAKPTMMLVMPAQEEVLRILIAAGPMSKPDLIVASGRRPHTVTRALVHLQNSGHVVIAANGSTYQATGALTKQEQAILDCFPSKKAHRTANDIVVATKASGTEIRATYFALYRLVGAGYLEETDGEERKLWKKQYRRVRVAPGAIKLATDLTAEVRPLARKPKKARHTAQRDAAALDRFKEARRRLDVIAPVLTAPPQKVLAVAKAAAATANLSLDTVLTWLDRYDDKDPLGSLEPGSTRRASSNCPSGFENRRIVSLTSPAMVRIVLALLEHGPMDRHQLAVAARVSVRTLDSQNYLADLCCVSKIHICDWRRGKGGPWTPVYRAGPGINVKRPVALTNAEIKRNKRRADGQLKARHQLGAWAVLAGPLVITSQ